MQTIETTIQTLPADLQSDVKRSLLVPQRGPYHNEGPFLASHLSLMFATCEDVAKGRFHADVPTAIRDIMRGSLVEFAPLVPWYVVLHDMEKGNCLTLVYQDDSKKAVSWNEWMLVLGEADVDSDDAEGITRFCRTQGITQISYYQQTPDGKRSHGKMAAERLTGRGDVDDAFVVKAIDNHEIATQFGGEKGGINIPLFERTFESWKSEEMGFALLVNYLDQMASLNRSGEPDISDFLWLAKTYVAFQQWKELNLLIATTSLNLERGKVVKVMEAVRQSPTAFQTEDAVHAYTRIVAECAFPSYDEGKLHNELAPFVARGVLDADTLEQLVSALTTIGQFPADVGKRLGKNNGPIRKAVARAVKS